MRHLMLAAACLALAAPARAQYPYVRPQTNPYNKPVVSPWINLNRGGNPAVNLYGLVQPQLETSSTLTQLQQQQQALATGAVALGGNQNLPTTGHPTRFLNYSHYFLRQGGQTTDGTAGASQFGSTYAGAGTAPNNPFAPQRFRPPGR